MVFLETYIKKSWNSAPFLCLFLAVLLLQISDVNKVVHAQGLGLYENRPDGPTADLLRVRTLIRANVLDLAESILEDRAPPPLPTDAWQAWEQQLWALYAFRGKWRELFARVRQIPPAFPLPIRKEADYQAAVSLIELGQGAKARRILRKSIISSESSEIDRRKLRKLVVESYLAAGMYAAAESAMRKYQLDYRSQQEDWLFLSAQVYLNLGEVENAINLLVTLDFPRAKLLNLYARLLHGSITGKQAVDRLVKIAALSDINDGRGRLRDDEVKAVSVYIADLQHDVVGYISELEQYIVLATTKAHSGESPFPVFSLSDLLGAYSLYALEVANSVGLLDGEYSQWFHYAVQLPINNLAVKKVIYGHLLQNIKDPIFKLQISNFFVNTLVHSDSMEIIPILYGEGRPFGTLSLSGNVGLTLSNLAIEQGNIRLAALVNDSLTEVPDGMNVDQWLLHTSRISIIAGQYDKGSDRIGGWISKMPHIAPEQIDQMLQLVFDLQAAGQHNLALKLLELIWPKVSTEKHEREISYWIAESYQATHQYLKAADYFLYSALLTNNGFDQWGRSARFRAAESLQSANLISDAKAVYTDLRNRATDKNRKVQLQQKIQELWILESGLDHESDSIEP